MGESTQSVTLHDILAEAESIPANCSFGKVTELEKERREKNFTEDIVLTQHTT